MKLQNRAILISWTVLVVVLDLAYTLEFVKGVRSLSYLMVFVALSLVPLVATLVLAMRGKCTKQIKYLVAWGYFVFYLYCMFTAKNGITFTYSVPMLFALVTYMDVKLIRAFGGMNLLANIISVVRDIVLHSDSWKTNLTVYEIQIALTAICMVFAMLAVKTVAKDNELKMQDIQHVNASLSDTMLNIEAVSKDVNSESEVLEQVLETVQEGATSVKVAIGEIVSGTQQVSDAIETQMFKTNEIQNIISLTNSMEEETKGQVDLMHSQVESGLLDVRGLSESASTIQECSSQVQANMKVLCETVTQMNDVVNIISNISGKTNMLALNAAIEAARVGEAGKGFAVVAGQINTLSSGTKEAIESINAMIEKLTISANEASVSVGNVIQLNEKQNGLINNVDGIFTKISDQTSICKNNIDKGQEQFAKLLEANTEIVNSIAGISAVSQQVTANAMQVEESAEGGRESATKAFSIVKSLRDEVQSLQSNIV